ncbi:MAG: hypothetical protein K1X86_15455 [Ignavibacteria bacterium]|nr:hypothetical protein [Ignavibacteria bacterium]
MADTNNLKLGEGTLTVQFEGENAPVDVGFCRNCDMDFKVNSISIEDGLNQSPIDSLDTNSAVSLEIELMEPTMRNFVLAVGGTPSDIEVVEESGSLIYKPAGGVQTSKFCQVVYKVRQVKNKTKQDIYTFYKCKSLEGVKFSHRKNKELVFKVKLMAFSDPENNGAPYQIEYNALLD